MNGPISARSITPWHLWLVGALALLWSGFGAFDYVMTQTRNASYLSALSPEQLAYFYGFPKWVVAAWALSVWGGVLGAVLLLLRKRWAVRAFALSLVTIVLTSFYNFVLTDSVAIMGGAGRTHLQRGDLRYRRRAADLRTTARPHRRAALAGHCRRRGLHRPCHSILRSARYRSERCCRSRSGCSAGSIEPWSGSLPGGRTSTSESFRSSGSGSSESSLRYRLSAVRRNAIGCSSSSRAE